MLRSTQLAKLFPLSLLLLLVMAIGSTGQGDKSKSKTQGPTTTASESVPLVVERGSDSRIDSHVMPFDPVVVILRLMGLPTDQKSQSAKRNQGSTREEPAHSFYEDADPSSFIFCGPSGISAEDFEAFQGYWESPAPIEYVSPSSPRGPATREDAPESASEEGDRSSFIFCGPSDISVEDFEASQGLLESPPPSSPAIAPPARAAITGSERKASKRLLNKKGTRN